MEELQKFIDERFDEYRYGVSDFGSNPPEYSEKMSKASEEIKKYIQEKYPSIIVNKGILNKIEFARTRCHNAWNKKERFDREVERGAIGVDMRRGPWANHDVAIATEEYAGSCEKLFSCIEISQKIDPNNIDEKVFEELRKQGKISTRLVNVGNEYVKENIINFSNPLMQYAYDKYCEDKEKKEQIQNLHNEIKERDEVISQDTKTIQTLVNTTAKYRKAIEDDKSTLQKMNETIQTTTKKVGGLEKMYELEVKKSIFARIKEKIQGIFNKNLMLPEHIKFNESVKNVQQDLNSNGEQAKQRLSQIDKDVALNKSDMEITSMMHKRTSMLTKIKEMVKSKSDKEKER